MEEEEKKGEEGCEGGDKKTVFYYSRVFEVWTSSSPRLAFSLYADTKVATFKRTLTFVTQETEVNYTPFLWSQVG